MPPRKSTSRPRRSVARPAESSASSSVPQGASLESTAAQASTSASTAAGPSSLPQPTASSSSVTLDDFPPDIPESITWDYVAPRRKPQVLTKADKERLVHEIVNFAPYLVLRDVAEHARQQIYPLVSSIESWAEAMARGAAQEKEVGAGAHALETLLTLHIDTAFDNFTAYQLRNTFMIPDGIEPVMPWLEGSDFDRGEFVTQLPGGEGALVSRLDQLRAHVEQARLVRHRLALAEAALDRQLEVAYQRRAQVGFVRDAIVKAGLAPLPEKATDITAALTRLHESLAPLEPPGVRPPPVPATDAGAWEAGRQAYLSWAVGKALSAASAAGAPAGPESARAHAQGEASAERLDAVQKEMEGVGTQADLDALARGVQ